MRKAFRQSTRPLLLAVILLSALISCKPKRPAGILSPTQMEKLLVDYHLAQGMIEAENDAKNIEELRYTYIRAALKKHQIDEAVFDSSMIYYSANAEQMALICARVCDRIKAMGGAIGNGNNDYNSSSKYAHLTNQGDTANVWTGIQHATLSSDILHNLLMLTWEADSATRPGDSFIWHCNTQKVTPMNLPDVHIQLITRYENDTVASVSTRAYGDKEVELYWQPTSKLDSLKPAMVTAMIYMSSKEQRKDEPQGKNVPDVLLLRNISLIRIHPKKEEKAITSDSIDAKMDSIDAKIDSSAHNQKFMEEQRTELPKPRISPSELRDARPHANTIHIQKEPSNHNPLIKRNLRPRREIKR